MKRRLSLLLRRLAALAALITAGALGGCDRAAARDAALIAGGDPDRGKALIRHYGCGACHTIPGVRGANSLVAPPLTGMAQRMYIAGLLPNAPENMVRWIQNPQAVDPGNAMPNMGISAAEARHIAAYLYTLR